MKLPKFQKAAPVAVLCLTGVLIASCAINPATGKRQLVLVSESEERDLGRQYDKSMVADLGLYRDDGLNAYVQQLGKRLASLSERPDLDWKFRVVDDPVVNAFALPGGYVYITRGILAHLNSEAELVAILGHEIGHVTARHSVNQMSKAKLAEFGLGVGSVLAPEAAASYGGLAQSGLGLLFLKYSRDDERQADELGLRYLIRAGYDPRPMIEVFETLRRVGAGEGGQRVPGWMSTHPMAENRRDWASRAIAEKTKDFSGRPVKRDEYLTRLEGLDFGDDPQQGFFDGSLFLLPNMKLRLRFPEGWKLINQRSYVAGQSPEQDAVIRMSLSAEADPAAALDKFLSQRGLSSAPPTLGRIRDFRTAGGGFTVASEQGTLRGLVAFVAHEGKVFQLLGYAPEDRWDGYRREVTSALESFDRLTDTTALSARAARVHAVRLSQSMGLGTFASRYDASVPVATLALINRVETDARLEAGQTYKVVQGGRTP